MAAIIIIPDAISLEEGVLWIRGNCRIQGYPEGVAWETTIDWTADSATINSAIRAAAVAAAEAASALVVGGDNTIMLAAAT